MTLEEYKRKTQQVCDSVNCDKNISINFEGIVVAYATVVFGASVVAEALRRRMLSEVDIPSLFEEIKRITVKNE